MLFFVWLNKELCVKAFNLYDAGCKNINNPR